MLDKENSGEADSRVFLYTRDFGKVVANAKGLRKITSKLAAHLEPTTWSVVRLINGKSWQITDALRQRRLSNQRLSKVFGLVKEISPLEHPDPWLWQFWQTIYEDSYSPEAAAAAVLKITGFDHQHATCYNCHQSQPERFLLHSAHYVCDNCWGQLGDREPDFRLAC